jgi:small subunit ribosomal protein S15
MDKETKQKVIKKFSIKDEDTGSADVQIAVLTSRIKELTEHFKQHPKDNHSRRGLIGMVNRRRKLLKYLSRTQHDRYLDIVKKLKLRR